jgi:hypothetical protein
MVAVAERALLCVELRIAHARLHQAPEVALGQPSRGAAVRAVAPTSGIGVITSAIRIRKYASASLPLGRTSLP